MTVFLFDIDGTLLLARGLGQRLFEEAVEEVAGRRIDAGGVSFAGRTDRSLAREILTRGGLEDREDLIDALLDAYAARLEASIRPPQVTVLPGVHELLTGLEGRTDLGLLTGNVERTGWAKLRAGGLDRYFGFGAFGSDHEDRNALPRFACERAGTALGRRVEFEDLIVVGDTAHDIACGKAVGARTVGVCTGVDGGASLRAAGPDLLMADFSDPGPLYRLAGL